MIYTIGFTKTSAEFFFDRLKSRGIEKVIDIRLSNKSQLAGFAKYPDIAWFLKELCNIEYLHDDSLAPTEEILKAYHKHEIDWNGYVVLFDELMKKRNSIEYIKHRYASMKDCNICLLCSEPTPEQCHRRLVAELFSQAFDSEVQHL